MRRRLTGMLVLAAMLAGGAAFAEPWRFAVMGDTRGSDLGGINSNILSEIGRSIANDNVELVLVTGDMVTTGNEAGFRDWTNAMGPTYRADVAVYPVRGNHDQADPTGWVNVFGPDVPDNGPGGEVDFTYYVTNRNALFIGSDHYFNLNNMRTNWINGVLASNHQPHVYSFAHAPAFKVRHTDCMDDYPEMRNEFWTSMTNARSKVYFCGHDHFYDHARIDDGDGDPRNDSHQCIIGASGAPLYPEAAYNGNNAPYTPVKQLFVSQFSYMVVEIDGYDVTHWFRVRTAPNVYSVGETFSYNMWTATNPSPAHASSDALVDTLLSWVMPPYGTSNDVYFGTDASAISNATRASSEYMGNQDANTYDPGRLNFVTPYYWRVDSCEADGSAYTGRVWRFETETALPRITNDGGASNIINGAADINGIIVSTGGAPTEVYLYWGTNDPGAAMTGWTHTNYLGYRARGFFTTNITLNDGVLQYYYRYYATNSSGEAWADSTEPFYGKEPSVTNITPAAGTLITRHFMNIDVQFSSAVTNVDEGDLVLSGAAAGSASVRAVLDLGGHQWQFQLQGLTNGALNIDLAPDPNDIEDMSGIDLAPRPTTWSYTVDRHGAPLPFYEGFEGGSMSSFFTTLSSHPDGRMQLTTNNNPLVGSWHLTMDRGPTTGLTLNQVDLELDIAGSSNVVLTFMHNDYGDETHTLPASFTGSTAGDGVSVSGDGTTWYRVLNLGLGPDTNVEYQVDIDAAIAMHGLESDRSFWIRFQQTDDEAIPLDGMAFDEINVSEAVIETYYVSKTGQHVAPFTNWITAATNIQDAINESGIGGIVVVSNGVYMSASYVSLAKGTKLLSLNGPESTIIDGNGAGTCLVLSYPTALVDGFGIRNGYTGFGSGITFIDYGTARNCMIYSNESLSYAGGVELYQGGLLQNCLVFDNIAGFVAGIECYKGGRVENCTITENSATSAVGGVSCAFGGQVVNSIVYSNTAPSLPNWYGLSNHNYRSSCSAPAMPGTNNIIADPAFVNSASFDFRLTEGSPCIDSGSTLPSVSRDFDGLSRPLNGDAVGESLYDMGAFEFAHTNTDSDADHMMDADELIAGYDPGDGNSYFGVTRQLDTAGTNLLVIWETLPDRSYTVYTTTNLMSSWSVVSDVAYSNRSGSGRSIYFTNSAALDRTRYFRVGVTYP